MATDDEIAFLRGRTEALTRFIHVSWHVAAEVIAPFVHETISHKVSEVTYPFGQERSFVMQQKQTPPERGLCACC